MNRNSIAATVTEKTADQVLEIIEPTSAWLRSLDASRVSITPSPERWSIQEVIGHLIDSAANNHQRFVRAQQEESVLEFADYEQKFWVERQDYLAGNWIEMIELWRLYNRHLAHVMRRIVPGKLSVICRITPHADQTLEFLITDYVVHMRHHLDIITGRVESGDY